MMELWVKRGIEKGLFSFSENRNKITYKKIDKSYKFTHPEEPVRAKYYLELVEKYGYEWPRIDFEVSVPRRVPNDFADIVIYHDAERKQPFIVIECKKDGVSDADFEQAIEQAFGNTNSLRAKYTGVVAGDTRRFFDAGGHQASERQKNIIADIPVKYGTVEEFRFKKGDVNWDLQPVEKEVLIRSLEKCHDTLWDGGTMDPTEAFDELSKFIFVKMQDELMPRKKHEPYDFQIKTNETPESVCRRIKAMYNKAKAADPEVFSDSLASTPGKIFSVVNHLQRINLSKTDLDTKGVAFERFMEDFFKGKQGQYFTPREVVSFIVEMCDVDHTSFVLDPACGSGGFLLHAMNHIRGKASDYYAPGSADHYRHWHDFAANKLFGLEINERISRIAKMNLIIHDDGHTNIVRHDALDDMEKLNSLNRELSVDRFDLILTNPPFGATVKSDEKPFLKNFELGRKIKGEIRDSQKSEILFIERCWQFLKPGTGHLAIVLPDGILTNHTQHYVRKFISERFEVKAIISLPQVTFEHYGAGPKSSILVLRKKTAEEPEVDNNVFSAIIQNVGYDGTGRTTENELLEIPQKYHQFLDGKSYSNENLFSKRISQFNNNRLDPYYYSPLFEKIEKELLGSRYPLKPLKDVCLKQGIFSGKTPAKKEYSDKSIDPEIVKVSTLKRGKVDFNFVQHVDPETIPKKRQKKVVKDGDILILSASHQTDYIGKNPCIVEIPRGKSKDIMFVAELMCIRVDKDIVNPYYLLQLLETPQFYLLVNREKRGQTSHIYPRDIRNIRIPVPDIEAQNLNAEKFKKQYRKYEEHMKEAEAILRKASSEFADFFIIIA